MNYLDALFPDSVQTVYSDHPPEHLELLPPEDEATRRMRETRIREFAHGRACARQALAALGFSPCPIPVGENREPVWPNQVVGSISHCGQRAAAVAACQSDIRGLGVDIELNDELEEPLMKMVCRAEELQRLDQGGADDCLGKLIFSAKESLFKCTWPTLKQFIDFQDIEIRLDLTAKSFAAIAQNRRLPGTFIHRIQGRYIRTGDLIITAAFVD